MNKKVFVLGVAGIVFSAILIGVYSQKENISVSKQTIISKNDISVTPKKEKNIPIKPLEVVIPKEVKIKKSNSNFTQTKTVKSVLVKQNEVTSIEELNFPTQVLYHVKETPKVEPKVLSVEPKKSTPKVAVYHHSHFFDYHHPLKALQQEQSKHSTYLWTIHDTQAMYTTPQGVTIEVPANAFVDAYNHLVKGEIVLEVKELSHPKEFLLTHTPTQIGTEVNAAQILWYLSASLKGKPVFLAKNVSITFNLPTNEPLKLAQGTRKYTSEIDWQWAEEENIIKTFKIQELGWVGTFSTLQKPNTDLKVNIHAPAGVNPSEISVVYVDEHTYSALKHKYAISPTLSKRAKLSRKIKHYTEGDIYEGTLPLNKNGKVIAIAYDRNQYYYAEETQLSKPTYQLTLKPCSKSDIQNYIYPSHP